MKKVLFVIPDAHNCSTAAQLDWLARSLPRERFACRVCVLGSDGPFARRLRAAGMAVDVLGWQRLVDGRPLWRLRRLLQIYRPNLIHTWRPSALRAVALAGAGRTMLPRGCAIVVSAQGVANVSSPWRLLEQQLLRRADVVVASDQADVKRCLVLGVAAERLQLVPPAVLPESAAANSWECAGVTVAAPDRRLACVGPLMTDEGFQDALWAFDILQQRYDDLHLLLIGAGRDGDRLQRFVAAIGAQQRVHLLGQPHDIRHHLSGVDVVWILSRTAGGMHEALQAMAAAKPVVATRSPALAEAVEDGSTGFLTPSGDRVALARRTRLLLDDSELRRNMGEAGRQQAFDRFPTDAMLRRFVQIYDAMKAA